MSRAVASAGRHGRRALSSAAQASLAAALSFLVPGLGQLFNGQPRLAILLAIPALVVVGVLAALMTGAGGTVWLLDVRVLIGLVTVDLLLLGWRLFAVVHAHLGRSRLRWRGPATWATALLLIVTLGMHAVPAWYGARLALSLTTISGEGRAAHPRSPPTEGPGSSTPPPSDETEIDSVELDRRLSVLLIGTDAAAGRDMVLTDTIMIASLGATDPAPVLISVPRDLYGVPLPDGRVYNAKLNSLRQYARDRPEEFPGGGTETLKQTIADLVGMRIDHVATVDIGGLRQIVDALGGVEVDVRQRIDDPQYRDPFTGQRGLSLAPGTFHMNGDLALAYVRSRLGPGDDDFVRAGRQQRLLNALRRRIEEKGLVAALPSLLDVIDRQVRTDISGDELPPLAQTVIDGDWSALRGEVLDPPRYVTPSTGPAGAYVLVPNLDAIRDRTAEILGR